MLYQQIYNMNPNIDMTYTRSFIDVFFWNAVYDIYPKKKAQGIHDEGVLATFNIWAAFVSTIRSESTLSNVIFQ